MPFPPGSFPASVKFQSPRVIPVRPLLPGFSFAKISKVIWKQTGKLKFYRSVECMAQELFVVFQRRISQKPAPERQLANEVGFAIDREHQQFVITHLHK